MCLNPLLLWFSYGAGNLTEARTRGEALLCSLVTDMLGWYISQVITGVLGKHVPPSF